MTAGEAAPAPGETGMTGATASTASTASTGSSVSLPPSHLPWLSAVAMFAAHAAVASSMAGGALAFPSSSSSSSVTTDTTCNATSTWPGWAGIKYAFIFGDSYTQTGFNYSITPAPSQDNPLGNPPYPGWTSSNGPNWVDYLTVKYNASRLQTYNLAYGGATVDTDIVKPYAPTVLSVKDQVHSEFLPGYTSHGNSDLDTSPTHPSAPDAPAWTGNNSVFAVWIGINDIGNSFWLDNVTDINTKIFEVYGDLVGLLYNAGARNFAFLTVPPIERCPMMLADSDLARTAQKADIATFNGLVRNQLAAGLKAEHGDKVNVWVVDTQIPFNAVLDNVAAYPQTAGLKNTTAFCDAYGNGNLKPDTFIKSCGVPVNEYFWLNNLHPTYPIHDVVAEEVAKALTAGPNVCSGNSTGGNGTSDGVSKRGGKGNMRGL
ncbi:hypothetical protein SBRCBS47491_007985 [Sporothrix bragantina]|uniref:Carbohydrate esterase family 16 protein n=1 Tax=Sporothrix bragantina TaxID=671064 RepID=A0ABP0CKI7_9PEZI